MTLAMFLKQLAVKLSEDNVALPLRNQRAWHQLFYQLKQSNAVGKPAFLADLWFDWDGPTPEAPDITEFLTRLHWNASISAANPQYDVATLPGPIQQLWKEQAPPLQGAEADFLTDAVARAKQAFGAVVQQHA